MIDQFCGFIRDSDAEELTLNLIYLNRNLKFGIQPPILVDQNLSVIDQFCGFIRDSDAEELTLNLIYLNRNLKFGIQPPILVDQNLSVIVNTLLVSKILLKKYIMACC